MILSKVNGDFMKFKAKLNLKFYIVSFLFAGIVAIGWYGLYFLITNEILMENNTPMDVRTKTAFIVIICAVVLSWTISLLTIIRQIILKQAFSIDGEGIHNTATAINIFAFIFVIPIKKIPFEAIDDITQENEVLTLLIDKSKIDVFPMFRFLVTKRYHFFSGFTVEKTEEIKEELRKYIPNFH